jgi:hypothetical protein
VTGHSLCMRGPGLLTIIYLLIGAFLAGSRGYFGDIGTLEGVVSALLAIVLWPLLLVGVDLRVNF